MDRPFLLVPVLFFCALFACRPARPAAGERHLSLALFSRFQANYDPVANQVMAYQPLYSLLYDTLFRLDDRLQPNPWLVERYESRGRTVTFHLRPGLRFSDGRPVTAADAVASINRGLFGGPTPHPFYRSIAGGEADVARKGGALRGVRVLSPRSFCIDFLQPNDDFPYYLTSLCFAIRPAGPERTPPVASGMYSLLDEIPGPDRTRVRLKRNPLHHLGADPGVEEIEFVCYPKEDDFFRAIQAGQVDAFFNFLKPSLPGVPDSYRLYKIPLQGGFYFLLNAARGSCADPALRRFLADRFDFQSLIHRQGWEFVSPANRILPYGLPEYFLFRRIERPAPADFRFARPRRIRCLSQPTSIRPALMAHLQEALRPSNVILDLEWVDYQQLVERQTRGDFDQTSFYYMIDVPLAIHFYELMFTPGLELNPGCAVSDAQALLADYRRERDERRRLDILDRLEGIARRENFLIPVFNSISVLGFRRPLGRLSLNYMLQFTIDPER